MNKRYGIISFILIFGALIVRSISFSNCDDLVPGASALGCENKLVVWTFGIISAVMLIMAFAKFKDQTIASKILTFLALIIIILMTIWTYLLINPLYGM